MPSRALILLAPLLIAAGPPPSPCGQAPAADPRSPAPTDLLGRPVPATPLVSSALAVVPADVEACGEVQPRSDQLRDARSDALHGLPPSDLMQVVPPQSGH